MPTLSEIDAIVHDLIQKAALREQAHFRAGTRLAESDPVKSRHHFREWIEERRTLNELLCCAGFAHGQLIEVAGRAFRIARPGLPCQDAGAALPRDEPELAMDR
jgi:DNA-binding SARP family transcriptional activator